MQEIKQALIKFKVQIIFGFYLTASLLILGLLLPLIVSSKMNILLMTFLFLTIINILLITFYLILKKYHQQSEK